MGKRLFALVLTIAVVCGGVWAQQKQGHVMPATVRGLGTNKVVGEAQLEVQYALNATDIEDENTYIDLHVLRAGHTMSKHYSRFLERGDSLYDAYMKANPLAESAPRGVYSIGRNGTYWSEYQYSEIFIAGGQMTVYSWMPFAMTRYNGYYVEPTDQQRWTLHAETTDILGHHCQRATCHWRGRDFEAWFANDIPARLGPWKFGGLPGLILKVYDIGKLYTWEAVGLRSGRFPITKRDYKGFRRDSRDHIYQLQVAANRDFLKTGGARDRKTGELKSSPHPYEPLEKE